MCIRKILKELREVKEKKINESSRWTTINLIKIRNSNTIFTNNNNFFILEQRQITK